MTFQGVRVRSTVRLHRDVIHASGAKLAGLIYEPDAVAAKPVVLAHGYTGCKESMDVLASYLCSTGRMCITFDFRGHKLGGSDGVMGAAGDAVEDVLAAFERLLVRSGSKDAEVVGHSMGGAAGLAASTSDDRITAVALLGTSASVASGFDSPAGDVLMAQRGDYVVGAPAMTILLEIGRLCREAIGRRPIPALFVAGRHDIIVRADAVRELAHAYGSHAEFIIVEGGHVDLPVRARGFVAAWLDRVSGESRESRSG